MICDPQMYCVTQVENHWSKMIFLYQSSFHVLSTLYIDHYFSSFCFHYTRILLEIHKETCFLQIHIKIGLVSQMKHLCLPKVLLYKGKDSVRS